MLYKSHPICSTVSQTVHIRGRKMHTWKYAAPCFITRVGWFTPEGVIASKLPRQVAGRSYASKIGKL